MPSLCRILALCLIAGACTAPVDDQHGASGGNNSGGGSSGAGGTVSGGSNGSSSGGSYGNSGGSYGSSSGGSGTGGLAITTGSGGQGVSGSGGAIMPPNVDHCLYGFSARTDEDDKMKSGPVRFKTSSGDDTILQPEVLKWMDDNKWTGAHVLWHAVRGCAAGMAAGLSGPLGLPNICTDYPVLVPADQNCKTSGDGYQFLLFHRHMLQTLKALWPKHAADFDGFPKFPTTKQELPDVWNSADPKWTQTTLDAAAIGDNIDKPENMAKFPDEGSLGHWLQCAVGSAKLFSTEPYIGLHFNLHDQWSRGSSSEHGLNNGQVNITNYMFWKLHGWIDNVWEKYRVAKGLTKADSPEMQKYKRDLTQSCNEMDIEIQILKQGTGKVVLDCPPDVDETGTFHTMVRPIFETEKNHCASCHGPSQSSPYADLTLGGQVSSKCLVERLKRASNDGGQFKLVEPGDPNKSYLYLKASGRAADAGCVSSDPNKPCNTAAMPPGGKTMTDAELKVLYDWIKAGANYP